MYQNHHEVWDKVLAILKDEVHPNTLLTWFKPIQPIKLTTRP